MRKGSKHTPEAIAKIVKNNARRGKRFVFSDAHRKHLSEANKGQVPWIRGGHQSPNHIKKRVQSRLRNGNYSHQPRGEEHYLWKKDRTKIKRYWDERNNPEYKQWRMSVYKRDGFKCRIDDYKCSGKIVAHHILPWSKFPELRYKINNGITLCQQHHPRKRIDEERLSPYFQDMISVKAH